MYSVYNTAGFLMFIWYAAVRWTMFANKIKYSWAYTPINLTTAFLSIPFLLNGLIPIFNKNLLLNKIFYFIALFLWFRNIYYTIEDVYDYPSDPKTQGFYVAVDMVMVIFVTMYLVKYRGLLL